MDITKNLRKLRVDRKLTQSEVSEKMGFVSDKFNLDTRERIAKALEEMEIQKAPIKGLNYCFSNSLTL